MKSLDILHTQTWGNVFETAVKRGVLYYLQHQNLIEATTPGLEEWRTLRLHKLLEQVHSNLGVRDSNPDAQAVVSEYARHLLVTGYGLGWTVMQQWLAALQTPYATQFKYQNMPWTLAYLWAPLTLPKHYLGERETARAREARLTRFTQVLGLTEHPDDGWGAKGKPPQADFLLGLVAPDQQLYLLCLEFSLNALPKLADFRTEAAHLDELKQYVKLIQRRGVFTRMNTEVTDDFCISDKLVHFIGALTTDDKPLYKLFQGCSYLTEFVKLLRSQNKITGAVNAQVIAVTAAGLEAMSATLTPTTPSTKAQLMQHFAQVYPAIPTTAADMDDNIRQRETEAIFKQIAKALPGMWKDKLLATLKFPFNTEPTLFLTLNETLQSGDDFINPCQLLPKEQLLAWAGDDHSVADFLQQPVRPALLQALATIGKTEAQINLRDIHAAAIHAGIRAGKANCINVLCLEGHPGIGKTTAIQEAISQLTDGYLFIYVSPRVLINNEVSSKAATHVDVLTLTSNFILNRGAKAWYQKNADKYPLSLKNVNGAVSCYLPQDFIIPNVGILFLTAAQADQITGDFSSMGLKSQWRDDHNKALTQYTFSGVMRTLADACRASLKINPILNKVMLTVSIQSYRNLSGINTIDTLIKSLFIKAGGFQELQDFAQRFRNIIVMTDEITGDGAGALIVREFADTLTKYFLKPYQRLNCASPFRLILAIADASLGNAAMLSNYLKVSPNSTAAPEKILISSGRPHQPFSLASAPLQLGNKSYPALHVMADSFPARHLQIHYQVSLASLCIEEKLNGHLPHLREVLREKTEKETLRRTVMTIFEAVQRLPAEEQIILFAQDKAFLRQLEKILHQPSELEKLAIPRETWQPLKTAKLDSSISVQDRRHRMKNRDEARVWLMTSSGSRGISLPKATHIIAFIPRFAIESGLMEIVQLIYRGRGTDNDERDRHITLILQDFIFYEKHEPLEPLYWTRRLIDMITMLVILRSTMMTRIQGDAKIQGQNLAMVPVGEITAHDSVTTLSALLKDFLAEAKTCKIDRDLPDEARGVAARAYDLACEVFSKMQWHNLHDHASLHSITDVKRLRSFVDETSRLSQVLLETKVTQELPQHWACTGALIFEKWAVGKTDEKIGLENWDEQFALKQQHLSKLLGIMDKEAHFPEKIRRASRDLRITVDDEMDIKHEFNIIKELKSNRAWVVLPVDYLRFMHNPDEDTLKPLEMPEEWLVTLTSAATLYVSAAAQHPVIPQYRDFPFFAMISRGDPVNLAHILDTSYFSATTEMNLLNTLLFV